MTNRDDSNIKKTDNGVELESSILDATLAAMAFAGPEGAAIAVGVKAVLLTKDILGFLGYLKGDTSTADAIHSLQNQVNRIQFELHLINERLAQIIQDQAAIENRATLQRLLDYLNGINEKILELKNTPSNDLVASVNIANSSGILVDTFLRDNYDIWRWSDVEKQSYYDPADGITLVTFPVLARLKFKNLPTLPVYLMAVFTWLTARERVVQMGERARLEDDPGRINRHLAAVSVRPGFDKYHYGLSGDLQSITEHIKWRIRATPIPSTRLSVNRICTWNYDLQNWMSGERKIGDSFDIYTESDNVVCTLDPASLGMPSIEIEAEVEAGVEVLNELSEALKYVAETGTLRKQLIAPFPTGEAYPPAILYIISQNEELHWYRNEESSRPGGSTSWQGPKVVGTGWGSFTSVFSGGGAAIYGVRPNGELLWYGHDGFFDGSPSWRGPKVVGTGWNEFKSIFSGGESVVYGIQPNGDLLWYRHNAPQSGGDASTWTGPIRVGTGWAHFTKVFSGGDGIIYAIREDGGLLRYKHLGYLNGTQDWAPYQEIGTNWNTVHDIVASRDGVLYVFTRDGRIVWYRYGERKIPSGPTTHSVVTIWEGPVEIKRNLPGFRRVFAWMDARVPVLP